MKQSSKEFFKKDEKDKKFCRIRKQTSVPESLFWCFFCEFCRTCKNIFFVEQHQTTASGYSSINSSEGGIGKRNCKLNTQTKAYILFEECQVSVIKRAVQVKE